MSVFPLGESAAMGFLHFPGLGSKSHTFMQVGVKVKMFKHELSNELSSHQL